MRRQWGQGPGPKMNAVPDSITITDNRNGEQIVRGPEDFAIGYRHVGLKEASDEIFAGAWFRFPAGDAEVARTRRRELLERRIATQPLRQLLASANEELQSANEELLTSKERLRAVGSIFDIELTRPLSHWE